MEAIDALLAFYESGDFEEEFRRKQVHQVSDMLHGLMDLGESIEVLAVFTDEVELFSEHVLVRKTNFKKSLGVCVIYIYSNDNFEDSRYPHVHIVSNERVPDVCVRLDCALYFIHGKHTGTFNNDQAKLFDEVMRSGNDQNTPWNRAKTIYNSQHPNKKLTRVHQPNYSLLNELKTEEECNERDKDK